MIDLQIKNTDDSGGLKRGLHYYPVVKMDKCLQVGLTKRSDGTTDADGILYPNNLNNSTNLGTLNSFLTNLGGVLGVSTNDEMFTNNQTKVLVGAEWFSKYKRLIHISMMSGIKARQAATSQSTDSNTGPWKIIPLDSSRALTLWKAAGSGLFAQVISRDGSNVITYGTSQQIHPNNEGSSKEVVDGVLIDTDKVFVVYTEGGTGKGICLSISGVAITAGSAVTIQDSTTASCIGVTKLDTNKVVVAWQENSSCFVECCTVSGTTITEGSVVNAGTSRANPYVIGDSTTTAFLIMKVSSGNGEKGRVLSISGTTITANTESDVSTTGNVVRRHQYFKAASNKFVCFTTDDKGIVISVSGTSFSVNSNTMSTGFISTYGSSWGALIELTAGSAYQYYQGIGGGNYGIRVCAITVSGTTVSDGTAETLTTDTSGNQQYMYQIHADKWGSDIGIISLGNQQSFVVYIAAAGATTYELYNDSTIIGSTRTDNFSFVSKAIVTDVNVNSKKMYFGIKNTSGASRYISLTSLTAEVK
ncbi:MAG: hypothetical protein KA052_00465 [Candidatus Pacebacteria bacterium]|nr:hypothetical protein [Candidatus Paceibacterota bacterium]